MKHLPIAAWSGNKVFVHIAFYFYREAVRFARLLHKLFVCSAKIKAHQSRYAKLQLSTEGLRQIYS